MISLVYCSKENVESGKHSRMREPRKRCRGSDYDLTLDDTWENNQSRRVRDFACDNYRD